MMTISKTRGMMAQAERVCGAMTPTRAFALLALSIGLLPGAAGCGHKNADAGDPDPKYYKGATFHGRNAQVNAPSTTPHGA